MPAVPKTLTPFERCLALFTKVAPGEGRTVIIFAGYAALIVCSFYIFKTIREPLLLGNSDATAKSYATALSAVILFLLMPIYGRLFHHMEKNHLLSSLALIFAVMGLGFIPLYRAGLSIGYAYYIWIAIYGVAMVAHFWAFAAAAFNVKAGQRLFPMFLIGASLGGIIGAELTASLLNVIGIEGLLGLAASILMATALLPPVALHSVSDAARADHETTSPVSRKPSHLGGISIVLGSSYLVFIAAYIVILNIVNTTGEYLLAEVILGHVDQISNDPGVREGMIGLFYARFTFWVTTAGLIIQLFIVSKLYARYGACMTTLVLPTLAIVGYALAGAIPLFSMIFLLKTLENSLDYSIMNTTRQALFLPTSYEEKFAGKTTIDTLFWRIGDLLQVLIIYVGANVLDWGISQFALFNASLGIIWFWLARKVISGYRERVQQQRGSAPIVNIPPQDINYWPGKALAIDLPEDTFIDHDPGDVLSYHARLGNGAALPAWLTFNAERLSFRGVPPTEDNDDYQIALTATDYVGLSVTHCFYLRRTL